MKKKAKDLDTPADLSEASYEHACGQLRMLFKNMPHYCDIYPTLKVSIWDADIAIQIAAKYKNCDIFITRNYRCDEWSVSAIEHETEIEYEIHTDGA